MCRLLFVHSKASQAIAPHLEYFAEISLESKEYQGHGWGISFLKDGEWQHYKNIKPIWEDDLGQFGESSFWVAHARSAFQDEGIVVENNMPFASSNYVFAFNGELRGVRIREEGRIGAEKIFNYLQRFFAKESLLDGLEKGSQIISRRCRYVRAMNIILLTKSEAAVLNMFNEDPDYFTLHVREREEETIVCSMPYSGETDWTPMHNGKLLDFKRESA